MSDTGENKTDADETSPGGVGRSEIPEESVSSESELSMEKAAAAKADKDKSDK